MVSRVLDASAFYAGIPFADSSKGFTTSKVFDEIKHVKKNHDAIQILLDTRRLSIRDPCLGSIQKVEKFSAGTGDLNELSEADISIVALCLELNAELVTDDFSLSNVAKGMGLKVSPIMTSGIREIRRWTSYCVGCNKFFSKGKVCPNCGNPLRKKLVKRKSLSVPLDE